MALNLKTILYTLFCIHLSKWIVKDFLISLWRPQNDSLQNAFQSLSYPKRLSSKIKAVDQERGGRFIDPLKRKEVGIRIGLCLTRSRKGNRLHK
jgi:hypothetical protein